MNSNSYPIYCYLHFFFTYKIWFFLFVYFGIHCRWFRLLFIFVSSIVIYYGRIEGTTLEEPKKNTIGNNEFSVWIFFIILEFNVSENKILEAFVTINLIRLWMMGEARDRVFIFIRKNFLNFSNFSPDCSKQFSRNEFFSVWFD